MYSYSVTVVRVGTDEAISTAYDSKRDALAAFRGACFAAGADVNADAFYTKMPLHCNRKTFGSAKGSIQISIRRNNRRA